MVGAPTIGYMCLSPEIPPWCRADQGLGWAPGVWTGLQKCRTAGLGGRGWLDTGPCRSGTSIPGWIWRLVSAC
ncbi:hypothetical protein CENSYa_0130 [Cenarchaeum symbiosum A]|uniref:Uncharacterized protein n=1 Tax=Cenarchaeum symbiosum (strain A) TaxID=414004 RepID=A0RTV8_CENSY|nr:hypothetical protein CENSYa_0130 [Cenarchaeum symbiosum A]